MDLKKALIKHISDPFLLWKWGDYAVFRYSRGLGRSQFLSTEDLQILQLHRLRLLLEHAYRRCPFYRERFQSIGLSPDDIRSPDDLRLLPPLEKREIQEHSNRMVAEGWPRGDLFVDHTGGSTGTPIAFASSRERGCWGKAATRRHNAWAGWEIGDRVAYVWGAPRDQPSNAWRSRLRNAL